MNEIKPCPVCGGEAGSTYYYRDNWLWRLAAKQTGSVFFVWLATTFSQARWYVQCCEDEEHARTVYSKTREDAIALWDLVCESYKNDE